MVPYDFLNEFYMFGLLCATHQRAFFSRPSNMLAMYTGLLIVVSSIVSKPRSIGENSFVAMHNLHSVHGLVVPLLKVIMFFYLSSDLQK